MWFLGLLLLVVIGAAVARSRGVNLLPAATPRKLLPGAGLEAYAEDNGWKLYPGDDERVSGEAWKVFKLAGPPGLDSLYAVKALAARRYGQVEIHIDEDWDLDALLRRDTAEGPETVAGASAAGGIHAVIACVATQGTVERFGLDAVGWPVKIHSSGEPPEGIDFEAVLAGLGTPLRLRLSEGTLLLRVPGTMEPKLVKTLLERLDMVRDLLPRRPDLGPQR